MAENGKTDLLTDNTKPISLHLWRGIKSLCTEWDDATHMPSIQEMGGGGGKKSFSLYSKTYFIMETLAASSL